MFARILLTIAIEQNSGKNPILKPYRNEEKRMAAITMLFQSAQGEYL
jgi:hypothetical protein